MCFCFSYCIYVVLLSAQWGGSNGIEAQSLGPLFLQCFDTVGWVFWPIKPLPDMTYNVFGGTLNLAQFNLLYGRLSGTTNVNRYQKKQSLTHTYYDHFSRLLSAFSIYNNRLQPPVQFTCLTISLFCCSSKIMSSVPCLSPISLLGTLFFTLTSHIHLIILISARIYAKCTNYWLIINRNVQNNLLLKMTFWFYRVVWWHFKV